MPTTARLQTNLRKVPGMTIVDLVGDIDGFGEEALDAAYTEAAKEGPAMILLNFARVSYVNSKGIALLITLLIRARESGHALFASGLSDHYLEIFEITRLSDFITVVPDEAAALRAARRGLEPGANTPSHNGDAESERGEGSNKDKSRPKVYRDA